VQPICRLPPEIFVIIFLYTQHENNAYFTVEFFSSYKPRWLRVMLGCRYFRDVAVHAPVLWSAYHCLSPKAYRELCLQRSADSILRICIGEGTIAEIAPHAHRVHAAALSYEALEIALDIPMPQLQWLEVTALGAHQFILSSSSFGRTAARLTHLHLFGRSIVLCEHPPRLPELRQLKLDSFRTWRNPRRMVALLASAPSLEVLSVAHLLVDFSSLIMALPITIPEPVTLPRLKTLQIVQSDFETAFLLRLIPMPSFALSDSLQSSEPHVNVPLHLGTYHTKVYEVCAAFARSTHQPECLQKGVQKFGSVLPYEVGSEFVISGPYHLNDLGHSLEQPRLHLSFNYDASHFYHPLLNSIETLHILRTWYHRNCSNITNFDWAIGTKHVPNSRIVVVDIGRPLAELLGLQDWVIGRGGRIEKMVFARDTLGVEIEAFMTDLRERGLASLPEVAWLP
jgi:hypothetical protein